LAVADIANDITYYALRIHYALCIIAAVSCALLAQAHAVFFATRTSQAKFNISEANAAVASAQQVQSGRAQETRKLPRSAGRECTAFTFAIGGNY
jgi:hypothetical protein